MQGGGFKSPDDSSFTYHFFPQGIHHLAALAGCCVAPVVGVTLMTDVAAGADEKQSAPAWLEGHH